MTRAYTPRRSTRDLVSQIEALDGIDTVRIIAPHHGPEPMPARLLVTLEPGGAQAGEPARTIFSLSEARAWLAQEQREAAEASRYDGISGVYPPRPHDPLCGMAQAPEER